MLDHEFVKHVADLYTHIDLIALKNRVDPDFSTHLRNLYRQFSITFHVPITEAEKLDLAYVLLHLREHHYFSLPDEQIKKAKRNLLYNVTHDVDKEDEEWIAQLEYEELQKEQKRLDEQNKKVRSPPLPNIELKF